MQNALLVGVGGFFGAIARYVIGIWLTPWLVQLTGWAMPYGTLFVNVTGSLLLGAFLAWSRAKLPVDSDLALLIGTGFFGAYTTYSTFATESVKLLRQGSAADGVLYILLTTTLCLVSAFAGFMLSEGLLTR